MIQDGRIFNLKQFQGHRDDMMNFRARAEEGE